MAATPTHLTERIACSLALRQPIRRPSFPAPRGDAGPIRNDRELGGGSFSDNSSAKAQELNLGYTRLNGICRSVSCGSRAFYLDWRPASALKKKRCSTANQEAVPNPTEHPLETIYDAAANDIFGSWSHQSASRPRARVSVTARRSSIW